MPNPIRIQRRRTPGWRMPAGASYVGRPTVWGNPFVVGTPCGVFPESMGMRGAAEVLIPCLSVDQSLRFYRELLYGFVSPEMYPFGHDWAARFRERFRAHPLEQVRYSLRGRDLVCWCAGPWCHADVLIEVANEPLVCEGVP